MSCRLAAIVCSSAPFLLPLCARQSRSRRALQELIVSPRATVSRCIASSLGSQSHRRSSTRTRAVRPQKGKGAITARPQHEQLNPSPRYFEHPHHDAIEDIVGRLFQEVRNAVLARQRAISRGEQLPLVKELEVNVRSAQGLANQIKTEKVKCTSMVAARLLDLFRLSGSLTSGLQLWQWLLKQGHPCLNPSVYSSAITLLVEMGQPLVELETTYQDGLAKCSSTFLAYQSSATAILADRRLPIPRDGLQLLYAIMHARLRHGKVTAAYLALDAALRISPDRIPVAFYTHLMDSRPAPEAMVLCVMALRAHAALPSSSLTKLMVRLRQSSSPVTSVHVLQKNLDLTMAVIELARLQELSGLEMNKYVLSVLVSTIGCMIIRTMSGNVTSSNVDHYNKSITSCIRRLIEGLTSKGDRAEHRHSALLTLLPLAVRARDQETVDYADQNVRRTPELTSLDEYPILLLAAAMNGDVPALKDVWQQMKDSKGGVPELRDCQKLASHIAEFDLFSEPHHEAVHFLRSELRYYVDSEADCRKLIENAQQPRPRHDLASHQMMTTDTDLRPLVESLNRAVEQLLETKPKRTMMTSYLNSTPLRHSMELARSGGRSSSGTAQPFDTDLSGLPSPRPVFTDSRGLYEENLSIVYDSLTTDTDQTADSEVKTAVGSAGIPYDVHRYENWRDINRLLSLSAVFEQHKHAEVDGQRHGPSMGRDEAAGHKMKSSMRFADSKALALVHDWDGEIGLEKTAAVSEIKQKILELRGLV